MSASGFRSWVKRIFGGDPGTAAVLPASPRKLALAGVLVTAMAALAAMGVIQRWQEWRSGEERREASAGQVARTTLARHAEHLIAASKIGDQSAARSLFAALTPMLERMNDDPAFDVLPLRYCKLAAAHLASGVAALDARLFFWGDRAQFDAAMERCR